MQASSDFLTTMTKKGGGLRPSNHYITTIIYIYHCIYTGVAGHLGCQHDFTWNALGLPPRASSSTHSTVFMSVRIIRPFSLLGLA